tara:strand:+ start:459 stop:650 length:192 start_codon:yes stop_codon:yes gene_type:complete
MELGSIIVESIKNFGSKDKDDDNKENSCNPVERATVLSIDSSMPIQVKENDKKRPQCCSPTPR